MVPLHMKQMVYLEIHFQLSGLKIVKIDCFLEFLVLSVIFSFHFIIFSSLSFNSKTNCSFSLQFSSVISLFISHHISHDAIKELFYYWLKIITVISNSRTRSLDLSNHFVLEKASISLDCFLLLFCCVPTILAHWSSHLCPLLFDSRSIPFS